MVDTANDRSQTHLRPSLFGKGRARKKEGMSIWNPVLAVTAGVLCVTATGCASREPLSQEAQVARVIESEAGGRKLYSVSVREELQTPGEPPDRILTIRDGQRTVFTYRTMDGFLGAIPLRSDQDDLLSVWSGGSAYHFVVFGMKGDQIAELLNSGAKMLPEIVYSRDQSGNLQPLILVSLGAWDEPIDQWTTTIYRRSEAGYSEIAVVPFASRLTVVR